MKPYRNVNSRVWICRHRRNLIRSKLMGNARRRRRLMQHTKCLAGEIDKKGAAAAIFFMHSYPGSFCTPSRFF